jgi:arylsulfatase
MANDFKGEVKESPRKEILYFGQGGELNAIRTGDWKVHFATFRGNIATGVREVPSWPAIVNLRADPYEKAMHEADVGYLRWMGDNIWIFIPIQAAIRDFLATIPAYPFQSGASLNASGINYQTLKAAEVLKQLENLTPPGN